MHRHLNPSNWLLIFLAFVLMAFIKVQTAPSTGKTKMTLTASRTLFSIIK